MNIFGQKDFAFVMLLFYAKFAIAASTWYNIIVFKKQNHMGNRL